MNNLYLIDELNNFEIGNESLKDFFKNFKNKSKLIWNSIIQNHDECINIYKELISYKIDPSKYQVLLKNTQVNGLTKKEIQNNFSAISDSLNFINKELDKLPNDPKFIIDQIDKNSKIFKSITKFIQQKNAPINPTNLFQNKTNKSCYLLGFTSINDFSSLINVTKQTRNQLYANYSYILDLYEEIETETDNTTSTTHNNDEDNPIITTTSSSTTKTEIIRLTSPLFSICMGLLDCYEELVKHLKDIIKNLYKNIKNINQGIENYNKNNYNVYFDKGLELFGFGGPKDGQQEFSNVFGNIVYIEKYKQWYSPDYITIPEKYTTYNNKKMWYGTWIDNPYSKVEKVAAISRYLFTTNLNKTISFIVRTINQIENEDGVFNATADENTIINGNDKRFVFVQLEAFCSKYDGPCITMEIVFNRRIFWLVSTERSYFVFVPSSPSILNNVVPTNNQKSVVKISSINNFIDTNLPFSHPNQKSLPIKHVAILGKEDLDSMEKSPIEGDYDKDNTDVTINPSSEDTVADVDVRIDLTPDREQKLLKMFSYNIDFELDVYGIEGLKYKAKTLDTFIDSYFNNYFDSLNETLHQLYETPNENIQLIKNKLKIDIKNKEKFFDDLKDNYKKLEKMFLIVKKFAEENIIDEKDLKELENEQVEKQSNETTLMISTNFNDKDDILYLGNQLLSGKNKIKLSQYKFYKNKILENIEKDIYSVKDKNNISKLFNMFNIVFINTTNMLSKGKRFIEDITVYTK